jgi:uncharacterized membrane protein YbaN (DUF454 family)
MITSRLPQPALSLAEFAEPAPLHDPSVVHCSHGRLRVHLPHWSGSDGEQLAAAVGLLDGVTEVEANPLTGNLLIRFEPRQTSLAELLDALPAVRVLPPVPVLCGDLVEPSGPVYVTGMGRWVYTGLGWTSVGMAVVGAIMPGIPTAPFVILAGYFFIRSSPEAHAWLRQSRWFGPLLRDWEEHHAVRRSLRNTALALIGGSAVLTSLLPFALPLKLTILGLQAIGFGLVLQVRVIDHPAVSPA